MVSDHEYNRMSDAVSHLKGEVMALYAFAASVLSALSEEDRRRIAASFDKECEYARVVMLNAPVSEQVRAGFELKVKTLKERWEAR